MCAWQLSGSSGGIDKNLTLNNSAPLPTKSKSLGPNDVLVQIFSSALNPVDYKLAEVSLLRMVVYGTLATPGIDYAGRVVAIGKSPKSDIKPGQLVFGCTYQPTKFGTLAEYAVVPRSGCVPIPEDVKVADAASIGCAGHTAYQSIVPYVKSGERVFINGGSGGTGIFGIQIAKVIGCYVVASCSAANAELCKSLGADEVIDYRSQDVVESLKQKVNFDLVIDNVGRPSELYWEAHKFMTGKGIIAQVAFGPSLGSLYDVTTRLLWPGFLGGMKRRYSVVTLKPEASELQEMIEWMKEGKIKAVIDDVFDMEEKGAVRAFQKLKTGRAKGKILVRIAQE